MRLAPRILIRLGVVFSCCLGVLVPFAPDVAGAAVAGSKHDFTAVSGGSLTSTGVCGACHIAHKAEIGNVIWPRSLDEEKSKFTQRSNPDYAPGYTILCYDCHDNHANVAVDNDPPDASFDSARLPQDVAFDDDMKTTIPRDGLNNDDLPGYYENIPSGTAGFPVTGASASTYVSGHYFKNDPGFSGINQGDKLPCADCHDPHQTVNQAFIRANLGGKSLSGVKASTNLAYDPLTRDDKDSRRFCIACHGTSDQGANAAVAFSAINPLYGSGTIVIPPLSISVHRSTKIVACTDCHKHNGISVSCTDCHGFPPLLTLDDYPAGFDKNDPVLKNVENYPGGAGAHRRHKDALGAIGSEIFQCEICHGPDPGSATWHNLGDGSIPNGGNVNIMGLDTFWSPPGYPGSITPAYAGGGAGPASGDAAYTFSSLGGTPQRCSGVACHGNPLAGETAQLNWTDDMIDGDIPEPAATAEIQICKWCHDATPAMIFFGTDPFDSGQKNTLSNYAIGPNVMGNGFATTAGFGAEVNGHGVGLSGAVKAAYDSSAVNAGDGKAGAAKDCIVCHDATYVDNPAAPPAPTNIPVKTHFDSSFGSAEKRLWSGAAHQVNGVTISATATVAPNELCVACHQTAGTDAGTQVSHHGNAATGGYTPLETPNFTRVCRQCHNVHGANWNGAGRNLYMVGRWLDADQDGTGDAGEGSFVDSNATDATVNITAADNAVVFTSRTGADSFDENEGAYDTTGVADRDDICATCHAPATGGTTGTGGGDHSGTGAAFDMRGQDCTQCHDHDFDDAPATSDAFMPSGCEGCHGKAGWVNKGKDGVQCTDDDAPNVMTVHVGGSWLSVWDGEWWDTQQGGNDLTQQGGHGDPDGREGNPLLTPTCLSCHNTANPAAPSAGAHLDGTYNSLGTELPRGSVLWTPEDCSPPTPRPKGNLSTNTSHLLPAYFGGASGNNQSWQVAMDSFCYQCHANLASPVKGMWHALVGGIPALGAVQLGTHLTRATPTSYLTDADLTTGAGGLPNFAPCVSCHNPHGSMNTDSKAVGDPAAKNWMLIDDWYSGPTLCNNCHL